MRRSRRLSQGERWELGLFLAMLIAGCAFLTAVFRFDGLPALFAQTVSPAPAPLAATPGLYGTGVPGIVIGTPKPVISQAVQPAPSLAASTPAPPSPVEKRIAHTPAVHKPAEDIRWYKGVAYHYVKTIKLQVTAYAPDSRCCWPYPGTTTASGQSVKTNHGRLVAADTRVIPMHALVAVPGYGNGSPVPVLDRGGAIKGRRLDVLLPTFDKAKEWGTRTLEVRIYMPVD